MSSDRRDIDEISGVGGSSPTSRAKIWQRMQDELDLRDAQDAAAQTGGVAVPGQTEHVDFVQPIPQDPIDEGVGAVGAALGGGLQAVLRESPQDKRMGVMASLQADALARLEMQDHAEQVIAGVRESEQTDGNAVLHRQDELTTRKFERDQTERELQKSPESLGHAEDFVDRSSELDHRTAQERLEDQKDREQRRLGD
jgi:hypothetical protein